MLIRTDRRVYEGSDLQSTAKVRAISRDWHADVTEDHSCRIDCLRGIIPRIARKSLDGNLRWTE